MIKYTIVCPSCGKTKTFEKKFPSSRDNKFCCGGCASSYKNTVRWADPENRRRQSEKLREVNKNPELSQKHREAAKRRWDDPKYRKKTIQGIRKSHQTSAYRAKASSIQKAICSRPEVKAARSKRMKKLWQNPEFRQKITEAVVLQHQSQEYRDTMARIWTEEKRELASQQMKAIAAERDMAAVAQARWAKPGASKRHSEIVKTYWEDPEWAEQTLERQRK